MESFATPYPVLFHDGEQEHDKGQIGIHSVLSFKRFQALMAQKTGQAADSLSAVFVCRRMVDGADKRQKLPINANTNFCIILNQHNPTKEQDCYFLISVKKSKRDRKLARKKTVEMDTVDEEDASSSRTDSPPQERPSTNVGVEDQASPTRACSEDQAAVVLLKAAGIGSDDARGRKPEVRQEQGPVKEAAGDQKQPLPTQSAPLQSSWQTRRLPFAVKSENQQQSGGPGADLRELAGGWSPPVNGLGSQGHLRSVQHLQVGIPKMQEDKRGDQQPSINRTWNLVSGVETRAQQPNASSPRAWTGQIEMAMAGGTTSGAGHRGSQGAAGAPGSGSLASMQQPLAPRYPLVHSPGPWLQPLVGAQELSGMLKGLAEAAPRPDIPKYCKFCCLCKEHNRSPPPFHWCVDDRVVSGFRGPSPAGPIGRPCKRQVEAAA